MISRSNHQEIDEETEINWKKRRPEKRERERERRAETEKKKSAGHNTRLA